MWKEVDRGVSGLDAIQNDRVGQKGVTSYDFAQTKQHGVDTAAYSSENTSLDTNGENLELSGSISVGNNHAGNPIFSQPSGTGTSVFDFVLNYSNAKIKILLPQIDQLLFLKQKL